MESMGVVSACGCKEVYRFPNITYPYFSCICSFFAAASQLFVHFLYKNIFIVTATACLCACAFKT